MCNDIDIKQVFNLYDWHAVAICPRRTRCYLPHNHVLLLTGTWQSSTWSCLFPKSNFSMDGGLAGESERQVCNVVSIETESYYQISGELNFVLNEYVVAMFSL